MTPVLPSWKPTSSRAIASCHGAAAMAMPAKTTISTTALRAMTAVRLMRSAQTPQSGTSGAPTTKISELKMPMNARRASPATPSSRRRRRQEGEDLAHARRLDDRREAVDGEQGSPVVAGLAGHEVRVGMRRNYLQFGACC